MEKKIAPLPHRGILEIQGEDKAAFLQGLITNDILEVTPERTIYAALLTPQGRFLYDFFISEKEGSYFLETDTDRLEPLLKTLTLYKLRSKVTLTLRPELKVFALWGEGLGEVLNLPEERGKARDLVFIDPRLTELGARVIGERAFIGFHQVSPKDYILHRLSLGVPEGAEDMVPEKSIPLESGLDELQAISWTKGCYMGQELTARTKYRGLVRKRLFPVGIEGELSQTREIFKNNKPVGELRSYVNSHGLALLRLEALKGVGECMCGKARLKPYIPFWMQITAPS